MAENLENEGDEKVVVPNRGNGKVKKILKRTGWTILGILVVMWAIGFFAPEFTRTMPERMGTWLQNKIDAKNQAVLDAQVEVLREKYRNDFDGGKTPEETLDMLIEALKAGDVEKASRYWVLEKQEEELKHLRENILAEYGDLNKSISFYSRVGEKGLKKCNQKQDGCTFEYVYTETATTTYDIVGTNQKIIVPPREKTTEAFDVGLNHYSGVWKIE